MLSARHQDAGGGRCGVDSADNSALVRLPVDKLFKRASVYSMNAKLHCTQFGRSSEQLESMIDQPLLSLEEREVSQTQITPPAEPPPRTVSRRKPLPGHLPREIHVHQPESQCSGCGGKLRHLYEDVSEVLEYGVLITNRRNFRHPKSTPSSKVSKSSILPPSSKV